MSRGDRWLARCVWAAGLSVALGAAVATAHGLYEVVRAAGAPVPIAALYPLITDGLALVAYAATARLNHAGRRYAWTIVVLAAGLSGLAQASFLAGGVSSAPAWLRFGIGAWPATAAAIVAHLLYLLGVHHAGLVGYSEQGQRSYAPVDADVHRDDSASKHTEVEQHVARASREVVRAPASPVGAPARERARAAARDYHHRHHELPTVSQLMKLAGVARGTAGTALKELRADRPALQIVHANAETGPINDHGPQSQGQHQQQVRQRQPPSQTPSAEPVRPSKHQDQIQYLPSGTFWAIP